MKPAKPRSIVIATGIYPPEVGGPSIYAFKLKTALEQQGIAVTVVTYGTEKKLPTGVRHLWYFFRVLVPLIRADLCIALDTYSVGLPATVAGLLTRTPVYIRTGGDFLWEAWVARTGQLIPLPDFYKEPRQYTLKEKVIFQFTKLALHAATLVVFSTEWQRGIWLKPYGLNASRTALIENSYPGVAVHQTPSEKKFLWTGRQIPIKNLPLLRRAFARVSASRPEVSLEIAEKISHDELLRRVAGAYAVVLPSITDISPNYILEALSQSTPFICTEHTGIKDRLKDVGVFVDPLSEDELVAAIERLLNPEVYLALKERLTNFSFSRSYADIATEFLKLQGNT